ncbi:MAG TPA: 4-oxalocrotonate tautomerase family protein, partial [Burkholderiales bacterium]|nr:4-oxalocrotonate tautomerase family protein [Burkholderiales bacterium]
FQGNSRISGEKAMPYVSIRIAGKLTREQKKKIAEEITDTLERIAEKPRSYTYISFDELPHDNWAIAGKLLDEED